MIEYIIAQNPDDRILKKAQTILENDGVVVFPTDTNWVMTVRHDSKKAVERLYKIKGESRTHHFSLLCANVSMATDVAVISDHAFRFLRAHIPGHYTFILEAQRKVTKVLQASKTDREVGLRFPPAKLALTLIESFGAPLLSTNITSSMLGLALDIVPYGHLIDEQFGHAVDLIIDPSDYDFCGASTVISLMNDQVEIIREGAGEINF